MVPRTRTAIYSAIALAALAALPAAARKFYPDDPLLKEPPPLAVAKAKSQNINEYYDFFLNTFFEPGKKEFKHGEVAPSEAVNTLGEVPDSPWFTNRMGSRRMTITELKRGPGNASAPDMGEPWVVVSAKNQGVTPGLVVKDSHGQKYFIKFDPKTNPEMASAADVIGSKFFYAIGYNTPENYIVEFNAAQLSLTSESVFTDAVDRKRAMTQADVDAVLKKAQPDRNGRYRALASLTVPGDIMGPFSYYSTRSDDPNDIVPHERRRDLRGLYVFAEWLNHTDTKSINSLDSLVKENGLRYIKHFLIDFGAILGSDSFEAKSPRAGNVYLFDFKPAAEQFLSLGLYVPSWMRAEYPDIPEVGRLSYEGFDPETWKNNYPNPAFDQRTPGDTFWAAKKVMAFDDGEIRALVETGKFSDPRATDWITKCLIERRNRIGRAFFDDVLPLDNFAVRRGRLTYEDLAVKYGFRGARNYSVQWFEFDNGTGARKPLAANSFDVPESAVEYIGAQIRGDDPAKTVTVYLRSDRVTGVDRTW
jgi:hypothetical protein